jgi:broad specificity phosphatase PhoE
MRHGETYLPRLDTAMAGPEEDPALPLTPRGRERVEATARAMASLRIDAAASSTFHRSFETASLVAAPHGLTVERHAGLEELRVHPPGGGGGTLQEVARRYLDLARRLREEPADAVRLDCGRSMAEIVSGAEAALAEALAGPAERVLVVAHGGINRLLVTRFLGLPIARFLAIDQDFACVNVIEFAGSPRAGAGAGGRPWVRAMNVTSHDPFKGDAWAS